MTTYRSFCSPNELLILLVERFNIPIPHIFAQLDQHFVQPIQLKFIFIQDYI